jgi:cryptochrome
MTRRALLYFRKDLRLHDNPTLLAAIQANPDYLTPIFILDSHYVMHARCGVNRWDFLYSNYTTYILNDI